MFGRKKKAAAPAARPLDERVRTVTDESGMLDIPFLVLTLLLVAIGLIMLFSASYARPTTSSGRRALRFSALFSCWWSAA